MPNGRGRKGEKEEKERCKRGEIRGEGVDIA